MSSATALSDARDVKDYRLPPPDLPLPLPLPVFPEPVEPLLPVSLEPVCCEPVSPLERELEPVELLEHGCVLQGRSSRSSLVEGHGVPPFEEGVRIVRLRVSEPPPHVALHRVEGTQSLTTQFTGVA
jgi:hypothetical protein